MVDEHGFVLVDLDRGFQVVAQHLVVGDDLHRPTAEHETRSDEDGIPDLVCRGDALFDIGDGFALWLRDPERVQDVFETLAVLGAVDRGAVGADDLHAAVKERLREVDGGLPAERGDHADRFFKIDDRHHVLDGQRLKIEFIGAGVVGRNGLGVVVDDDGFVARLADGLHRVDGRVVEFDALSDADRSRAEDHDLLLFAEFRLVFTRVGRVEVGDVFAGVERVDHTEDRDDPVCLAETVDVDLGRLPEKTDLLVGESHDLRRFQRPDIAGLFGEDPLHFHDPPEAFEEQFGDHGHAVDLVDLCAQPEQFGDREDVVVVEDCDVVEQRVLFPPVELLQVEVADADLERANGFQKTFFKRRTDPHDLAGRLHLRTEHVRDGRELIEWEARELRDEVVERGFDRGVAARDRDLLERHTDRDLRRDARDGVAARF